MLLPSFGGLRRRPSANDETENDDPTASDQSAEAGLAGWPLSSALPALADAPPVLCCCQEDAGPDGGQGAAGDRARDRSEVSLTTTTTTTAADEGRGWAAWPPPRSLEQARPGSPSVPGSVTDCFAAAR